METIRGWKEKNVSLLAARCHPYHFLVPMLICRKTVPGGHDIVSLDTPAKATVVAKYFLSSECQESCHPKIIPSVLDGKTCSSQEDSCIRMLMESHIVQQHFSFL